MLQSVLLEAAIARLGPDRVGCNRRLAGLSQDERQVTGRFVSAEGETFRPSAEILLAADGIHSFTRAAFYPGELPADPAALLVPAREGRREWLDGDYAAMNFRPAANTLRPGDGPPHIRLDRAAEFLIGDRL